MAAWVVAVVLAYGGIVGLMCAFQRNLLYGPTPGQPERPAYGAEDMMIARYQTVDGLDLTGWYRPAAEGRATIVYFHGNGGHLGERVFKARPYMDRGYGMLLVGYRGYSGNPGRPTEVGLYSDGRAAIEWLAGQGVPAERIVLYGESLGSGVAVQMATEHPVAAAVLEAPFTSIADVGQRQYPFVPVDMLLVDRFDNLSKIDQLGAPLLVVHGERDRTVPPAFGRRLLAAAPEPKHGVFIPEAGHADLYEFNAVTHILEFLANQLPG